MAVVVAGMDMVLALIVGEKAPTTKRAREK
jgi:hypothetical protein